MRDKSRVGIMGGTFDPIHYGHLRAAEEALQALDLSRVIFIPAAVPPHKQHLPLTPSEDRYAMACLAVRGNRAFSVSRIEIDSAGVSYTRDTLFRLKQLEEFSGTEFYFITGYDAVLDILSWKEPEELLKLCRIVAVSRFGYSSDKLEGLSEKLKSAIINIEIPLLAISSTELRNRIRENKSIKYLVPPAVERYIRKKRLYE